MAKKTVGWIIKYQSRYLVTPKVGYYSTRQRDAVRFKSKEEALKAAFRDERVVKLVR